MKRTMTFTLEKIIRKEDENLQVEIKNYNQSHAIVSIIHRGRQYGTLWAKETDSEGVLLSPTIKQAEIAFKDDRKSFEPYNVQRGF
jgi:hypothetical protein